MTLFSQSHHHTQLYNSWYSFLRCTTSAAAADEAQLETRESSGPKGVAHNQQQQTEEPQGPQPLQQSHSVFRNEQLGQNVGDEGNLMSHTHKDEATEQDVEGGVSRDEH